MHGIASDLALLAVSFVIIIVGAVLFTNGVEWLGVRHRLSEGAVGSVLAAVGTALPETLIPCVALILYRSAEVHEIGLGAFLGPIAGGLAWRWNINGPFYLSASVLTLAAVMTLRCLRPEGRGASTGRANCW